MKTNTYLLFLFLSFQSLAQSPFITTWKTDNAGVTCDACIFIPTVGSGYNYDVDWDNDGVYDEINIQGDLMHDFGTPGTYTIAIRGDFPRIYFNGEVDSRKIININQWGDIIWSSMESAFKDCWFLECDADDIPNLSQVTSLKGCFEGCALFDKDIGNWDVSNVTDMSYLFYGADNFNQAIGSWDVSNVINMERMFSAAKNFNQNIGSWDVSNVTNMKWMFAIKEDFFSNLNIGSWDVSKVTSMRSMFWLSDHFNEDIGSWNVSSVVDMTDMFFRAYEFNQDIGSWDVSKVTNMRSMFGAAYEFNQDISAWDVSKVTDMDWTFLAARKFNQDISAWDVSNVTTMNWTFYDASVFNQNISIWDVSKVTSMNLMFAETYSFNQDLSIWDVSKVTNMTAMFFKSLAFDQSLENWDLSSLQIAESMLDSCGLSCENYGATLDGWSNNPSTPDGILFGAAAINYGSNSVASRNQLLNKGWSIIGDIQGECPVSSNEAQEISFALYPNPTSGYLQIESKTNYNYILFDSYGKRILQGSTPDKINLTGLTSGYYTICIVNNAGISLKNELILKN